MGRKNRLNPLAILFFIAIAVYGLRGDIVRRGIGWPWTPTDANPNSAPNDDPVTVPGSAPGGNTQRILAGTVERIADGDSIELRVGLSLERIRLAGIDAPEYFQPFGREARDRLRELCDGQSVHAVVFGKDRHGRLLADVYVRDRWVNGTMVADGHAWHFDRWDKSLELAEFQAEARRERRGLWADPTAIPPWDWRDQHPPTDSPAAR